MLTVTACMFRLPLHTKISVDSIRTASSDEAVGKRICEAQLIATVPADAVPTIPELKNQLRSIYDAQGVSMDGTSIKGQVTYTAQRTEDKGELMFRWWDICQS